MKIIASICFMLISTVACTIYGDENQKMSVDSNFADYNGNTITLTGEVSIEHEIGTITASKMEILPEDNEKKWPLDCLKMKQNVVIKLKGGGELKCYQADIHCKNLQGCFYGSPSQEVIFRETTQKDALSWLLKGQAMSIQFAKQEDNPASKTTIIQEIQANGQATFQYSHDLIASSDQAIYERLNPSAQDEESTKRSLAGLITLKSDRIPCKIASKNGDMINAQTVKIDTLKRQLSFEKPNGLFFIPSANKTKGEMDFSCDSLFWDEPKDFFLLKGNICLNQKNMGTLLCENEVYIYRQTINGAKKLKFIQCLGASQIDYFERQTGKKHIVKCQGNMIIDHEASHVFLESPKDASGHFIKDLQVSLEDRQGEIYADTVHIDYLNAPQGFILSKIILEGNVRLLNRSAAGDEDQGKFLQYALADKVEFYPEKHEMFLQAKEKKRVLFLDKKNSLQISAPALKINRGGDASKDSIQGIGDVRFSFIEQEFEQFKERFRIPKELKEKKI